MITTYRVTIELPHAHYVIDSTYAIPAIGSTVEFFEHKFLVKDVILYPDINQNERLKVTVLVDDTEFWKEVNKESE